MYLYVWSFGMHAGGAVAAVIVQLICLNCNGFILLLKFGMH